MPMLEGEVVISILCALAMGLALGALVLLGLYIAMVMAIGLGCVAVFGPFMLMDAYKGWLSKYSAVKRLEREMETRS